jgi:ribonuclease Z
LKFLTLGIGSASPHLERHPAASLISIDSTNILVDCGEGTQYRLLEHKIRLKHLQIILISHLHGDHFYGLVALISSMSMSKRTEPLHVFGPNGLKEIISTQLFYADSKLNFPLHFTILDPKNPQVFFESEKLRLESFPLKHRVDCTGFIIEKKKGNRGILAEKLPKGFSVENIKLLQQGQDVYDEKANKKYKNADYTLDSQPKKRIAYCSDTIFDEEIIPYVKDVDFLYHEATFTKELESRAKVTYHSTAEEAATIAKKAKVSQLIIGHFSSRYDSLESFLTEAQAVFPQTQLAEQGKTFII